MPEGWKTPECCTASGEHEGEGVTLNQFMLFDLRNQRRQSTSDHAPLVTVLSGILSWEHNLIGNICQSYVMHIILGGSTTG